MPPAPTSASSPPRWPSGRPRWPGRRSPALRSPSWASPRAQQAHKFPRPYRSLPDMPRAFTPKVVTANALVEGDVVYLTFDDRWTRDLAQAELITDEAHAQLRLLLAEGQPDQVVGVYLADVTDGPNGPEP